MLLETLDNVRSRITALSLEGGAWKRSEIPTPGLGTADVSGHGRRDGNASSSRTRTSRLPCPCGSPRRAAQPAKVKTMPAFFDATGVTTEQFEATSKDGTKIPYFVVPPKGSKTDGTAPTLLYGYGGFEVSEVPHYSGTVGSAWLARGGVYVAREHPRRRRVRSRLAQGAR